ncbi:alkene reductase [Planosporangium mesophilum]|uniref:Alkene reductase n=1 Tax=Planosporangium mesophilum TaxID=689768 RepID=A0A8J3T9J5_9ACTN|nr:alkene reductase [Planosporangium mesophilum]NJC81233.1 alkene reductase [Planosporangium mesophilum]GII21117.1 alkene reductase [Planosporangium mesophilum]
MSTLFHPFTLGKIELANRIALAPMTRNRAGADGVPQDITATYYAQRASAGLIITEGTQPSAVGQGYANTPGIHSAEQVRGWRAVADAVHERGGRIIMQLMHAGRIGHPDNKGGLESVAPSAIAAPDEIFTANGMQPYPVPRELATDELPDVVAEFVTAARNAVDAGLDGVELHAANGYLLHQFLAPSSNTRTDAYGGSPAARARFVVEVTRAVAEAIGPERVGIRISPAHNIQGVLETDPADVAATYGALIDAIAPLGLAYLHALADPASDLVVDLRRRFGGPFIANDGFASVTTQDAAKEILDDGLADLVAVGRAFLANPDLPRRWELGAPLNEPDSDTFYTPGERGYIDYPTLDR